MRSHVWLALTAVALLESVTSVKIPVSKVKRSSALQRRSGGGSISVSKPGSAIAHTNVLAASSSDDDSLDLNTVHDLIYMANVSIGGTDYPVQLDTGSSDLWIKGESTPLPNTNQTSTTYNLTYGIGWAYGHVSYAKAEFAGISVPSQAFLDVSAASNPALSYGADGILGLGFTSLSTIDAIVNASGASTGRSLLFNMFNDNPNEPNYIAFSLQRSTQSDDEVPGTFSIGETEDEYKAVLNKNAIPTWPVNSPKRWNVLLDNLIVGQTTVSVTTSVADAPSNKAVVLLDSGTSYTYAPKEVCDAIYGGVDGAKYDSSLGQWVVPCGTEIDMALQIGDQIFPVHPLDVTPYSLTDSSTCVGSFVPQSVSVGAGEFDWLLGDNVLRSVYSIYDFGDFDSSGNMGNPYIKLLSLIDPDKASAEFVEERGGTAKTNITYNVSNDSGTTSAPSLNQQIQDALGDVKKYIPAMIAVMALNAVVILTLVILGFVLLLRKNRILGGDTSSARPRSTVGRLSPMPMQPMDREASSSSHVYQPVSMALTEDTFVPPSPAYQKDFGGDTLKPPQAPSKLQRPMSVA